MPSPNPVGHARGAARILTEAGMGGEKKPRAARALAIGASAIRALAIRALEGLGGGSSSDRAAPRRPIAQRARAKAITGPVAGANPAMPVLDSYPRGICGAGV